MGQDWSSRLTLTNINVTSSSAIAERARDYLLSGSLRIGTLPPPPIGVSNARGYEKSRFSTNIRFISEIIQDRAIATSLNDLEWPLTQISRSRYYSTSNNSKTVQDRAIFTMADQQKVVYGLTNGAIFNDLEQPQPSFQGHAILWRWISHKRLDAAIVTMEGE